MGWWWGSGEGLKSLYGLARGLEIDFYLWMLNSHNATCAALLPKVHDRSPAAVILYGDGE